MYSKETLRKSIVKVFEDITGFNLNAYASNVRFSDIGLNLDVLNQVFSKLSSELGTDMILMPFAQSLDTLDNILLFFETHVVDNNKNVSKKDLIKSLIKQQKIINDQLLLLSKAEENTFTGNTFGTSTSTSTSTNIQLNKSDFNPVVEGFISKFIQNYNLKTKSSKEFIQKNRKNHADPKVIAGFRPDYKEIIYPIVVKKSYRQSFVDIDDNEYLDMLCGYGSNFFGNNNTRINNALHRQIDNGFEVGTQHPLVANVSDLVNELTGNDRTAFCNTGSEAVLGALRIARAVTSRKKIISFKGAYHGNGDEVIVRAIGNSKSFPAAVGINSSSVENMIVLDYEDEDSLIKVEELVIEGDIAAIIVEPVQSRNFDFQYKDKLRKLRQITELNNVCLIFDEVITGFRISLGGAQEYFGIRADLCTYGKILGGGIPIGAISGKEEYMNALDGGFWKFGDDSAPSSEVTCFAGAFLKHPLALVAAKTVLEILKDVGQNKLNELNKKSQDWVDSINLYTNEVEAPLRFSNFGSLVKPIWLNNKFKYSDLFFAHLRFLGLHQYEGSPWFINLSHSDRDLSFAKNCIIKTITTFQLNGLMEGKANLVNASSSSENRAFPFEFRSDEKELGNRAVLNLDEKTNAPFLQR